MDNLLVTLRACKTFGPYKTAEKEYKKSKGGGRFRKYIKDVNYVKYYNEAVELSAIYVRALHACYLVLKEGRDFTDRQKKWFLRVVSDADLSCPLKQDVLKKAKAAVKKQKNA